MNWYSRVGLVLSVVLVAIVSHWGGRVLTAEDGEKTKDWETFQMSELLQRRSASGRSYLQFLNVPTLNSGVYVLAKGAVDGQSPHKQDEIYYVVAGKGMIQVGSGDGAKSIPVEPGSVVFVKAGIEHRFHDISEELQLLVFFSAAESR